VTHYTDGSGARNLRIGYLTGQYPRATDTFIQREVAGLRERGVHVQTFSIRRPEIAERAGPDKEAERESTVYILPASLGRLLRAQSALLLGSPRRYLAGLLLAKRVRPAGVRALLWHLFYFVEAAVLAWEMRERNLSHLHNHFGDSSCTVAMLAAHLGGFSFSTSIHGPGEFLHPGKWALGEKASRALFVACISHFCRSQMMLWCPEEAWRRLHIVHCGVRAAEYEVVEHEGIGSRVVYVGRLTKVKALPILLDAVASLAERWPALELNLIGDGPERVALESCARRLGIERNVRILGYQSEEDVRNLLQQADVFAMSSLAEGVPVVLMEAMACGLPVVAPSVAGVGELVQAGVTGFITPPGDVATLADRIGQLLTNPELRNQMGRAGRAVVEDQFDLDREVEWLYRVMTSSLEGREEALRPDGVVRASSRTEA
jgi:colanic acid/amylovoran biosynthesis glycosyltransferase